MTRLKGEKMKKRILVSLLLLAVLTLFAFSAYAIDIEYTDDDPESGGTGENTTQKNIGGGTIYDVRIGKYIYKIGDMEVAVNYPSGSTVTSEVQFTVSGDAYVLIRDGKEITKPANNAVSAPGGYLIVINNDIENAVRFTIVKKETGKLYEYTVPEYFEITSATRNGENVKESSSSVDLTEEGEYSIGYQCAKTGVGYTINLVIDHTPPVLALKEVVDGHARGPVDITDLERGARMTVYVDGNLINVKDTLTQSGLYNITVEDKAGNQNVYNFRIDIYFNFDAVAFIVIVLVLITALVVYLVISRRKLRIR